MSPATPELCSEAVDGVTRNIVCLFREPDAGNPPVRFDEREQETEPCQTGLRRRRESFVSSHRETTVTAPVSTYSLAGFESKGLITTVISRTADLRRYFRPTGDYAFVAQARLPVLIQFDLAEVVLKGRNPLTSASRTLPSLLSGWGRRGRRLSRAKGNLDKPILPWCHHPTARKPCPIAGAPMRRWVR